MRHKLSSMQRQKNARWQTHNDEMMCLVSASTRWNYEIHSTLFISSFFSASSHNDHEYGYIPKKGIFVQTLHLKNPQSYKPFVVAIVATLQERKEDLPLFTDPYLRGFYQNIPQKRLLPVTIAAMTHYTRPDNVYKLENPMKRLAIITEDENISVENLPENTCRTSSFPNTT